MFKSVFKPLPTCLLIGFISTLAGAATLPKAVTPAKSASNLKAAHLPAATPLPGATGFHKDIQPLLKTYCYDCHGEGMKKGNVSLDEFVSDQALLDNRDLWWKALKNLRTGIMPPVKRPRPTDAEQARIAQWIKTAVFRIEPNNPDPGRATVRRLNRAEYRNTIRDLMGVDYDTQNEFPPDDNGNGFDNIGAALTLSPMLLEKYLNAAQTIVAQAVPTTSRVLAERTISGASFRPGDGGAANDNATGTRSLSYYEAATVTRTIHIEHPGTYQLVLNLSANEKYVGNKFDYNKCRLIFKADGQELLRQDYNRESGKLLHYTFDQQWAAGEHKLAFELQPLTPGVEQVRALALRIHTVTLRGPYDAQYQTEPPNYRRFFPKPVPDSVAGRHAYARALLGDFARRAFRRPLHEKLLARLTGLAEAIYTQPGQSFEMGVAQAMVAVLASPRFLFREEGVLPARDGKSYPLVDEYTLASRLSYFLWSSMPDDELFRLAGQGLLRKNLTAQAQRMLADPRSAALVQNFSGQWLQTRDIETVPINARAVLEREADPATNTDGDKGNRRPRIQLDDGLRKDLHREADLYFDYIVHADRNVTELIDSNYTFLNARLAQYYGLSNLNLDDEFRKVTLPADSPRGGVLTMGSVLAVTSNPTRTSPVKRGLFILDNVLGSPAPPPPPNLPPLEASEAGFNHHPTLREVLAVHRGQPLCASCHNRLDPPGLALENFNALGMWRDQERGQPIEAGGTLITGETFSNVRELKRVLATRHDTDFYRCLTEKLFTYALGRGLEDYDVESVDRIVDGLEHNNGHFSTLVMGIIASAPFQKSQIAATPAAAETPKQLSPHVKARQPAHKSAPAGPKPSVPTWEHHATLNPVSPPGDTQPPGSPAAISSDGRHNTVNATKGKP